jgi:SulP family sulfate permease
MLVGLFAALFGGTPALISEPTGPMTVVMTAVIAKNLAAHPEGGLATAFFVVILAGLVQILMGSLKLGRFITRMPYSVVSGFMSGIGVILIILQVPSLMGHPAPPGGVLGTLRSLPELVGDVSVPEAVLGGITLVALLAIGKNIRRRVPVELAVLVLATLASVVIFATGDIRRIGPVPFGLPQLRLPVLRIEDLSGLVADAVVLGLLGSIDSLLTAVIADSLTRSEHNSDKELVGQGVGNIISGLLGGLPGAGATMGTVVNIQTGGRTAWSGVIRTVVLLAVVAGASSLTAWIPLAVLAAIAVRVGINVLDWSFLRRAHRLSWRSAAIMYLVIGLTVFLDLIVAVAVGVFLANIMTMDKLSKVQARNVRIISDADDTVPLNQEQRRMLYAAGGRVLLLHLSGPMIFATARAISREHAAMKGAAAVVIDLGDVSLIDVTVSLAIENAIRDTADSGRDVFVVAHDDEVRERLARLETIHRTSHPRVTLNRTEALRMALEAVQTKSDH